MKQKKSGAPSLPVAVHYLKLAFRTALFVLALVLYIIHHGKDTERPFGALGAYPPVVLAVWGLFMLGMILRLFPNRFESTGSKKHFASCYQPTGVAAPAHPHPTRRVLAVVLFWVLLNGTIGALYFLRVIDWGILVLISLFYAVGDMICVLFFCPFQVFFLHNRCCSSCRIYNWDSLMMVTPLIFVPHPLSLSLVAVGLFIFIRWELVALRHPERFLPETNAALSCAQCDEHLCKQRRRVLTLLRAPFTACRKKSKDGDTSPKE